MIVVQKIGPDPSFENLERYVLQVEIFETWAAAFEYLEQRTGPLDYETRKRAARMGFLDIEIPASSVMYKARFNK